MTRLFKSAILGVLLAAAGNGAAFGHDGSHDHSHGQEASTSTIPLPKNPQSIVSVGGGVTETIFALGAEKALVAVDTSSVYPEAATKLPQCGYQRTLSAEGVASLKPDLIFLAGAAGPPSAIAQLEKLGIPNVRLNEAHTLEAAKENILKIGATLEREEKAKELVAQIDEKIAALPKPTSRPKVLFILSAGGGRTLVSGKGTAADAMIELAGGENVAAEFTSFKPVSSEALVAMAPEVILTTSRTVGEFRDGGIEKALPGIALTPAGKANRIIVMEDLYLMGFGPRVGDALVDLSRQFHPASGAPGANVKPQ